MHMFPLHLELLQIFLGPQELTADTEAPLWEIGWRETTNPVTLSQRDSII